MADRFALALHLTDLAIDARNQGQALDIAAEVQPHDYVQDILNASPNQWNALINHPNPPRLANATAPLNGFRHYSIQDAGHFEYFYRVRMEAIARTGMFQEIEQFSKILPRGLAAVTQARNVITRQLGVQANDVQNEQPSQQLRDFIGLVAQIANRGDYLDTIIVLLPGILSYDHIAKGLLADTSTVRNTLYYPLFVQLYSATPAANQRQNVNRLIDALTPEQRAARWDGWVTNFQRGCTLEAQFFNLIDPGPFPAYNLVNNGNYRIRNYLDDRFLVSNGPNGVTTQVALPGGEGTWTLENAPGGYTIKNLAQQRFLATTVVEPLQLSYAVNISVDQQTWTINIVQNNVGRPYQLLVTGRLQYILDVVNNGANQTVAVTGNAQTATQIWLLVAV